MRLACKTQVHGDIEVEKGIVCEEILEDLDDEGRQIDADNLSRALIYPQHPLGFTITGLCAAVMAAFSWGTTDGAGSARTVRQAARAHPMTAAERRIYRAAAAGLRHRSPGCRG